MSPPPNTMQAVLADAALARFRRDMASRPEVALVASLLFFPLGLWALARLARVRALVVLLMLVPSACYMAAVALGELPATVGLITANWCQAWSIPIVAPEFAAPSRWLGRARTPVVRIGAMLQVVAIGGLMAVLFPHPLTIAAPLWSLATAIAFAAYRPAWQSGEVTPVAEAVDSPA